MDTTVMYIKYEDIAARLPGYLMMTAKPEEVKIAFKVVEPGE